MMTSFGSSSHQGQGGGWAETEAAQDCRRQLNEMQRLQDRMSVQLQREGELNGRLGAIIDRLLSLAVATRNKGEESVPVAAILAAIDPSPATLDRLRRGTRDAEFLP